MESALSRLNDSGKATDEYLIGVKDRLFEVGLDTNMNDIVPLSTRDDDKKDYRSRSNGNACRDGKVCVESDESDYHSDCSLGSLNSLYLNLKHKRPNVNITNGTNETQLQNQNSDTSKTDGTSGKNAVARTRVITNRKFCNRKNYEKPIKKLNAFYFYGMQNKQYGYSRKSFVRQLKRKYPVTSKIRKFKSSAAIHKYKRNFHKLRTSLTKRKHRKCITNKHLIRHRLKVTIPLLKWNDKVLKNRKQNSMRLTDSVEKSQRNKIEFITDRQTVSSEQGRHLGLEYISIKNESYESDVFSTRDFDDWSDGFEDTQMIDDIVKRLFDDEDDDEDDKLLIDEHVRWTSVFDNERTFEETTKNEY